VSSTSLDRQTPAEGVAGFLSAIAIFGSAIGIVSHPLRLIPFALILAFVAAAIGGRYRRLAFVAVMFSSVAFFLGLTVAVIFKHRLF
jgi:hypothetical protein